LPFFSFSIIRLTFRKPGHARMSNMILFYPDILPFFQISFFFFHHKSQAVSLHSSPCHTPSHFAQPCLAERFPKNARLSTPRCYILLYIYCNIARFFLSISAHKRRLLTLHHIRKKFYLPISSPTEQLTYHKSRRL
jgi:hypothetical protein